MGKVPERATRWRPTLPHARFEAVVGERSSIDCNRLNLDIVSVSRRWGVA